MLQLGRSKEDLREHSRKSFSKSRRKAWPASLTPSPLSRLSERQSRSGKSAQKRSAKREHRARSHPGIKPPTLLPRRCLRRMARRDGLPLTFAGLWERWKDGMLSCTILTIEACNGIRGTRGTRGTFWLARPGKIEFSGDRLQRPHKDALCATLNALR